MPDTPAIVEFVRFCRGMGAINRKWRRGKGDVVLWRCSRHGVRPGQRGLRILRMCPKSGGVPAVLGGAMILMGRLSEKPRPKR
jgi:hypothetical protein